MPHTMIEAIAQIPETVARGVAVLDVKYPNWREEISWDSLDVSESRYCIAGQLSKNSDFTTYMDFCDEALQLNTMSKRASHGFSVGALEDLPEDLLTEFCDLFYKLLTREWQKYRVAPSVVL